jgi:7,8-dihydroneopterin aldolase/epimerase/oxygenase
MSNSPVIQLTELSTTREADHIRIFLRDCKTELRVGVYDAEMHGPQTVRIDVEVEAELPHHYQDLTEKNLDRVIDYEPIYKFIQTELPRMGHIPLLETVAEQIIAFCFRDPRIQKVRIRLEKSRIFGNASAGIEVCRTRQIAKP